MQDLLIYLYSEIYMVDNFQSIEYSPFV